MECHCLSCGQLPTAGRILGLGDEIEDNVLMATIGSYVQGTPTVPVGQSDVGSKLHQQLDQLQVAINYRLVQCSLALWAKRVHIKLTVGHVLEKGMELLGVTLPYSLLEHPLGVRDGAGGHFCLAHGWEGSRWVEDQVSAWQRRQKAGLDPGRKDLEAGPVGRDLF